MASFKSLSAILLLACLAYVSAKELDVDAIEKELQESEWTDEPIEMDDSSEVDGRGDKKAPKCSCLTHYSCGCCIKPKIFGKKFPGCVNATLFATDTKNVELVEVALSFFENQIAQYNFTIQPINKMCKQMPKANWLSVCLYNNNTMTEENGFLSCSSMDILVKETAAAIFKFSCVQFKDDQISFVDNVDVGRDSWLSMKIKNPLKYVIDYFKKNKGE